MTGAPAPTAPLALLAPLAREALQDPAARRALLLGLSEEGLNLACAIATPLLLKQMVDALGRAHPHQLAVVLLPLVGSWVLPLALASLKPRHTAVLVGVLHSALSLPLLRGQLPCLASAEVPGAGEVAGLLERLPLSLQLTLDGLVWRTLPLVAQTLVGLVLLASAIAPTYALVLALTLAAYLRAADLGAARLSAAVTRTNQAVDRHAATLMELTGNAARVVYNGAIGLELALFQKASDGRFAAQAAAGRGLAAAGALQAMILFIGLGALVLLGAFDTSLRRMSVGSFVLLQALILRLTLPLAGLTITLRQLAGPLADIAQALRLGRGSATPPCRPPPPDPRAPALVLERLGYAHPTGAAVTDISLSLDRGQLVAMVGANGCGKSTLARLMAGLLTPDQGRVEVQGVDLQQVELTQRPRTILYVPQSLSLFSRSLLENGAYPPARTDPAGLAARLAELNFNANSGEVDLTAGVGERGVKLSGGQLQKLEIARVASLDVPVLLLDESTSALDPASEQTALAVLRQGPADRLVVLITHRRSLAQAADRIIFLREGRLVGLGSDQTLSADPDYRRLWA